MGYVTFLCWQELARKRHLRRLAAETNVMLAQERAERQRARKAAR